MYEDDVDYASRRLNSTLVRLLDGSPFFIDGTFRNSDGMLSHTGVNMTTEEPERVLHSSLNLEPVPLGFLNLSSGTVYTCRKPLRRDWRQGLAISNVHVYGSLRIGELKFKLFNQPILKQYPSFEKAVEKLGKKKAVAFSRDFALKLQGTVPTLYFKQYEVGILQDATPVLNTNKFFLQEHLTEVMG